MALSKKKISFLLSEKILFLYLALFPLGQLTRINVSFFGNVIPIFITDIVAGIAGGLVILGLVKTNNILRIFSGFLAAGVFSLIYSLTVFGSADVLIGTLYLLRLFAYLSLSIVAWNIVVNERMAKNTLYNSLILSSIFVGILGWIQYLWMPDTRFLRFLNWDDHWYRLVGTFLDPTYTGIILVFGFLASLVKYLYEKNGILWPILGFLLLSISFTYARAVYVSLFVGVLAILYLAKRTKAAIFVLFALGFSILLLPKNLPSEGVNLLRMYSVRAKLGNYRKTWEIVKSQPLFGVGFNNLCAANQKYLGNTLFESHSCSGSDSSLLLVLATTGIVGLILFINSIIMLLKNISKNYYGVTLMACVFTLLTHSLFVNSLFYPWVMGWMGILLAISIRNSKTRG